MLKYVRVLWGWDDQAPEDLSRVLVGDEGPLLLDAWMPPVNAAMDGNWFLMGDAVVGADVGLLRISHAR